jgi:hypothetical protein
MTVACQHRFVLNRRPFAVDKPRAVLAWVTRDTGCGRLAAYTEIKPISDYFRVVHYTGATPTFNCLPIVREKIEAL